MESNREKNIANSQVPLTERNGKMGKNKRKTLLEPRNHKTNLWLISIAFVLFLSGLYSSEIEPEFSLFQIIGINLSFVLLAILILDLIYRIVLFLEEMASLETRYGNSRSTLFNEIFVDLSLIFLLLLTFFLTFIVYIISKDYPWLLWCRFGPFAATLTVITTLILGLVFFMNFAPLKDALWISNSHGLDCGSGMAHSFFNGYLKLTLPKTGHSEKHLEEFMQDYEDKHGVKFDCYKLFILIPKSMYCPVSLKDVSPSIEESSSLAEKQLTIAGVQNRIYKHSVYEIRPPNAKNNKHIYVAAEYATPLKTFCENIRSGGHHADCYKKHNDEIVLQFYLTLKQVLKDNMDCNSSCELIYFDDLDKDGRPIDVGLVLIKRLEKLKKKCEKSGVPMKVKRQ